MGHCKKNEEKASEQQQEHKKHRSALRALKNGSIIKKRIFRYVIIFWTLAKGMYKCDLRKHFHKI